MIDIITTNNPAGVPIRYSTSILTDKERERILALAEEVKRTGGRLGIEQSERNPGSLYIRIWR